MGMTVRVTFVGFCPRRSGVEGSSTASADVFGFMFRSESNGPRCVRLGGGGVLVSTNDGVRDEEAGWYELELGA